MENENKTVETTETAEVKTEATEVKAEATETKTETKKFDWNKRIFCKGEGKSADVKPVIAWSILGGALALAIVLGLIIVLA